MTSFERFLAVFAIVPAWAPAYFFVFWTWFGFWRRHRALTYTFMLGTIAAFTVVIYMLRDPILAPRIDPPLVAQIAGWILVVAAGLLGTIADRQLGIHIRSFAPFFESNGRIELRTNGAYGIVRHPIYASGLWLQIGAALVTGCLAVAIAAVVLGLGAWWFTRQEERRLVELLVDPSAYDRYRARVPALLPFTRRRRA
jgi:protein-S-isoprenylcysteine O-methyltransferase Ste14